jgi:transcriptional regulator with XRE-family HTH domain
MQQRDLDPSASVPAFFGAELRRYRKAAGLTQEELGKLINYTGSLIGQIETTLKKPALAFAEMCDRVLDTGGFFARLWPLLSLYPARCVDLAALEASAVSIRSVEPVCIPGLLQTPAYARAVFQARAPHPDSEDLDQAVADVLQRQRILDRGTPSPLWCVVGEAALHILVGDRDVMRDQLAALLAASQAHRAVIQVMPSDAGAYMGFDGGFTLLTFEESPDAGYLSGPVRGMFLAVPDDMNACTHAYTMAIAKALPPTQSADFIRSVMETL